MMENVTRQNVLFSQKQSHSMTQFLRCYPVTRSLHFRSAIVSLLHFHSRSRLLRGNSIIPQEWPGLYFRQNKYVHYRGTVCLSLAQNYINLPFRKLLEICRLKDWHCAAHSFTLYAILLNFERKNQMSHYCIFYLYVT